MPFPELEPGSEECARKLALLHDIKTAMSELMDIHNREMQALIAEDFTRAEDFSILLQSARSRKAELIELYREHVTNHGC
jgi:hypothetical protein